MEIVILFEKENNYFQTKGMQPFPLTYKKTHPHRMSFICIIITAVHLSSTGTHKRYLSS